MVGAGGANPRLPDIAGLQAPVSRTQPSAEAGQLPFIDGTCSQSWQGTCRTNLNTLVVDAGDRQGDLVFDDRLPVSGDFCPQGTFDQATTTPLNRTLTLPAGDIDRDTAAGLRYRAGWL